MNLFDILFMQKTGKIKPDADLFDIMFAKVTGVVEKLVTIVGNPLSFLAKKAQIAKSTKVTLEPVQDLHGYDNPWPAGGGKNLVNVQDVSGITTQTTIAENLTFSAGTYTLSAYCSNSGSNEVGLRLLTQTGSTTIVTTTTTGSSSPSLISGTFALSEDVICRLVVRGSAAGYNATVTKVQVETGSTATSYAPYSNICPISGRSSVEIKGCGKNLFDKSATFNQHNGYILNDSGAQVSSVASGYTDPVTEVFPNTTYILTGELTEYNAADTANGFRVYYYTANGEFIGRSANLRPSTAVPFSSFTTPSNCRMLAYQWQFTHNYPQLNTIQLELGSTATDYEPYTESNDVTITFPAVGKNLFDSSVFDTYTEIIVYKTYDVANGTYTMSTPDFPMTSGYTNVFFIAGSVRSGASSSTNGVGLGTSRTITVTDGHYTIAYRSVNLPSSINNPKDFKWQIELGSTATSYEPYTNTVYGGTLDVETGVLTVDKGYVTFDGGASEAWSLFTETQVHQFYCTNRTVQGMARISAYSNITKYGVTVDTRSYNELGCYMVASGTQIAFQMQAAKDNFPTLTTWKSYLAEMYQNGTPVQAVYELATPRTIQLTPNEVELIKGVNNLWTDGDEIELTYKA